MSMKNSSDTILNRTRNLPVYSAVPQLSALPRAPIKGGILYKCFHIKLLTHVFKHRSTKYFVEKEIKCTVVFREHYCFGFVFIRKYKIII
jgi:hypothetical protein